MLSRENARNIVIALVVAVGVGFMANHSKAADPPSTVKKEITVRTDAIKACGDHQCVVGKLNGGIDFYCSIETKFNQVVCIFVPEEAVDDVLKKGIKDILQEAHDNGEKIQI